MSGRIQIADSFWLLAALVAFLDQSGIGMLFLLAASIHEAGHAAAVWLCGGQLLTLRLTALGGVMRYRLRRPQIGREVCIAAAGPLIGFLTAWLAAAGGYTLFAGANLLLSLVNLTPVRPLDGGQILQAILGPGKLLLGVEMLGCLCVSLMGTGLATHHGSYGLMVFWAVLWWNFRKNLQSTPK